MTDITRDELRQMIREEMEATIDRLDEALAKYMVLQPAAPPEAPARITYTPEAAAYLANATWKLRDGREVGVLEWAQERIADLFEDPIPTDAELTWQDRAFAYLWMSKLVEITAESYAAFWYYMSIAAKHPDWNVKGSPAWLVRQARERAIEEQREAQGGNPA